MQIPFRIIAIASDEAGALALLELARSRPALPIAVMLRDPLHRPEHVARIASSIVRATLPDNVTLIANGCAPPGIGAVHWPSRMLGDGPPAASSGLVGFSTHSPHDVERAAELGARYVTFGPIFPTGSKPGHPGVGLETLATICRGTSLPVFALGGITAGRIGTVIDAGAFGIAAISLFAHSHIPDLGPLAALP